MNQGRVLVGAIDQGTSSSRFLIFDAKTHDLVCSDQKSVKNTAVKAGWVEVDPLDLLQSVQACMQNALRKLVSHKIDPSCLKAIGLTNQRETTVAFDISSGKPLHNAISWMDARTSELAESLLNEVPNRNKDHFKSKCGLPICNYPSALKMLWLSQNVPAVKAALEEGTCRFATVDSWLLWNLTGGVQGGVFKTDLSNASRTGLLNINELQWDSELLSFFKVDKKTLAEISSSCEVFGLMNDQTADLKGVPISGILGDQMAALVGHQCLSYGKTKNTYGTGCFMLCNTGTTPVISENGLLTSVAYKMGPDQPVHYALEGSVAAAGLAISWMKDNLQLVKDVEDCERLAESVPDSGGCYFVPAFSGLLCPHWNLYARGLICGLTMMTKKEHIVRACLEAICFQTKDVAEAMSKDLGVELEVLKVDGGVTANRFLMQLQADLLGVSVARPLMTELTALGVASVAGAAAGVDVWQADQEEPQKTGDGSATMSSERLQVFHASTSLEERRVKHAKWKEALKRAYDWDTPNA